VADGTEGATITITLGTSRILVGICYRITGAVGLAVSTIATGSGSQPDSSNLTDILTSARDVLWLTLGGCDDAETLTNAPTNYVNGTLQASTATGTGGCTIFGASRQLNAASENPGAWTLGSTSIWMAWTVALSDAAFSSRVSQEHVETAILPDNQLARVTQVYAETAILPDTQLARMTQMYVEVIIQNITAAPRGRAYVID
jgi:hypothetical protein